MRADPAPPLAVICGPTAAGKSALAMRLAERHGLAIVSADSRQVYRGFDIGTAKPSPSDRARVRHFGVDVADPRERYSAARWSDEARAWLAEAGDAVVVGGTGFYLRALTAPLFDEPPLDTARRAAVQDAVDDMPTDELRRWCVALDPGRAHLGRAQLLRSIEVALLTGERLSDLHRRPPTRPALDARYLVVDPGPSLPGHIARRVAAMLDAGWVDEVRSLAAAVPPDAPAWSASGYRTARALAAGAIDRAAAAAAIAIETRQYAKRQRTWFRHQLPAGAVTTVDPHSADADDVVERWWSQRAAA